MKALDFLKSRIKEKKKVFTFFILTAIMARILDLSLIYCFKLVTDEANLLAKGNIESANNMWFFAIVLCLVGLFSKFSYRLNDYIEIRFSPKLSEEIAINLFSHITKHSISYFQNNFSGSISHKIKQISEITKYFLTFYTISLIQIFTVLFFSCIVIFTKSPLLAIFIFTFGLLYMYLSYIVAKKNKTLATDWSEQSSKVNGNLTDSIENMLLVKSLAKSKYEIDNIKEHLFEEKTKLINLKMNMNKIKIFHVIFSSTIITITLLSSVYLFINNRISIGDFFFIFMMITRLAGEFFYIGETTTDVVEKYGILSEGLAFIYKEQEDCINKPSINIKKGEVELKNINFSYNSNNLIFKDMNIHIKSGEKIAIVGHSGSGKTTLIKLILKQYKPKSGVVLIDGKNLNDFNVDSINQNITYIHQEIHLFNRSIRDNILYAKPNATEEELIDVCMKSGSLEFIKSKEKGFDTIIGERGVQLSGGEKQRIALARAFLLNNHILILDEPTSALDSISENIIQASLAKLIQNKTVIIIAHRLSTIKNMDKIIVMDKGEIVESGNHEYLINIHGKYSKLWKTQMY